MVLASPAHTRLSTQVRLVGFRYHPAIGGAEQHARRLLAEISTRLTIDVVTVVTSNRSDWLRLLIEGVRDQQEDYLVDGRAVRALPRWSPRTRRLMTALAPIYHLPYSPAPGLMGRLLASELAGVVDGAGLIHNIFMGREAFSLGLYLAARRSGVPFVFTPLRHQRPLGWNSPAFRELYRSADRLVALTRAEADWLISQGAGPDRVRVIPVGPLSDPAASPDLALQRLGDRRIVLFLGQLHDYKGFRQLLAAAGLLASRQDILFVFAGPDVRGHARAFANAPTNVRYLASVDDRLRDSLLRACEVLCVPSSRESFGGALLDAWACGKPVIGGPAPAVKELIDDGVDGWTVPQDPTAIADRLTTLLDDSGLRARMGEQGRRKVETRFSWASIASSYLELYAELGVRPH
ncbi:MAG: glycosyltransferase family 4 protein [Chloroflexi bacterium]|nr:MAG: glycosyltransferase family 4 protein [Chloroflexota bacterium]